MLKLSRKIGESIIINENIEVKLLEVRGKSVILGVAYPAGARVYRRELFDRIKAENEAAAQTAALIREGT